MGAAASRATALPGYPPSAKQQATLQDGSEQDARRAEEQAREPFQGAWAEVHVLESLPAVAADDAEIFVAWRGRLRAGRAVSPRAGGRLDAPAPLWLPLPILTGTRWSGGTCASSLGTSGGGAYAPGEQL